MSRQPCGKCARVWTSSAARPAATASPSSRCRSIPSARTLLCERDGEVVLHFRPILRQLRPRVGPPARRDRPSPPRPAGAGSPPPRARPLVPKRIAEVVLRHRPILRQLLAGADLQRGAIGRYRLAQQAQALCPLRARPLGPRAQRRGCSASSPNPAATAPACRPPARRERPLPPRPAGAGSPPPPRARPGPRAHCRGCTVVSPNPAATAPASGPPARRGRPSPPRPAAAGSPPRPRASPGPRAKSRGLFCVHRPICLWLLLSVKTSSAARWAFTASPSSRRLSRPRVRLAPSERALAEIVLRFGPVFGIRLTRVGGERAEADVGGFA